MKIPKHLRAATRRFFEAVMSDYDLKDHEVRTFILACEAYDQAQTAREILDKDGQTFTDRFGQPRERPEVSIYHNARLSYARLMRELSLEGASPEGPRLPRTQDYGSAR